MICHGGAPMSEQGAAAIEKKAEPWPAASFAQKNGKTRNARQILTAEVGNGKTPLQKNAQFFLGKNTCN